MTNLNCTRAVTKYDCPIIQSEAEPLFKKHHITYPEDCLFQLQPDIIGDDDRALVKFKSDGYSIHTSLETTEKLNKYIHSKLKEHNQLVTPETDLYVKRLHIKLNNSISHTKLNSQFPRIEDSTETPPYEYLIEDYLIKTLDDPFTLGIIMIPSNDTSIKKSKQILNRIEQTLTEI